MKNDQNMIEKVERLFIASYRKQPAVPAGLGWQAKVMNQIHELESIRDGVLSQIGMEKNIWRFAVATGLAALVMTVYMINTVLIPEN